MFSMPDHVGADNIFIFGNTAEEVEELRRQGYKPREYYEKDEELHQVLTQIGSGVLVRKIRVAIAIWFIRDQLLAITTRYWRIIAAMSIVRIKSMNSTSFRK